nr:ATP synthase F0 subunit 6 [Degeeriella rufa]
MFDPSSSSVGLFGVGKWLFMLAPLALLGWGVFMVHSGAGSLMCLLVVALKQMGLESVSSRKLRSVLIFLLVCFFSILWWNEVGLIPFGFGISSHLVINLSLGLVFVLSGTVCSIMLKGWKSLVAHMVPLGCPLGLSFVLAIVETVSFLIRPFTLSIRLTGNMITGHLLVALLYEMASSLMMAVPAASWLTVVVGCGLLLFELAVGVVQASIFTVLMLMYWSE